MSGSRVLSATLDHIALGSEDPERLSSFYSRAMGLSVRPCAGGWWGEGLERRLHFIHGTNRSLGYAAYQVADAGELDRLRGRLADANWPLEPSPSPRFGEAVALKDPDGNLLVFGIAPMEGGSETGRAARLQHIVVASTNAERLARFFQEVLGFVLSDNVVDEAGSIRTSFLRCSDEHHNFAVFQAAENRLDHHCYEAGDWGLIRDWGDHMASEHIPIVWGPGRHGPGNNLFLFIHDLDGNWVEISAELEVVTPERPAGAWPHEERTLNSWGRGFLRS
jgi:catechol 2,3-dioxygenase-like lactoylglutathione lyase family enzyme